MITENGSLVPKDTASTSQPKNVSIPLDFVSALAIVKSGLEEWKSKPHNAKWWKRIDGTPIPNDLCVNIAQKLGEARAAIEGEPHNEEHPPHAPCCIFCGLYQERRAERVLEAAPRERDELCATCGGNGSLKIPGGIEVCPACNGRCWA